MGQSTIPKLTSMTPGAPSKVPVVQTDDGRW
jgi:hypothetical protein